MKLGITARSFFAKPNGVVPSDSTAAPPETDRILIDVRQANRTEIKYQRCFGHKLGQPMCVLRGLRSRLRRWFSSSGNDPIKHVVVLMFENHSFDQMLGCFPQVNGVDPDHPRSNKDSTGREFFQRAWNDPIVKPDPMHELGHVLNQIKDGNSGFVSEYEKEYPETTNEQRQRIMDHFGMGDLPVLHELAKHFTICDYWYSSVPGPTWTNRFFVHSGTAKGLVTMPASISDTKYYLHYDQDTIFDRLNQAGKNGESTSEMSRNPWFWRISGILAMPSIIT